MIDLLGVLVLVAAPLLGLASIDGLTWARDRWLLLMAGLGLGLLARLEPMLAVSGLAVLAWWRTQRTLPAVATWAAITGGWFLARAMSPGARRWALWALLGMAVGQTALILVQWRTGRPPMGTFGHRTLAGSYLAVLFPLAVSTHWGLAVVLGIGLAVSCSWVAWIGAAVGLAWLLPWTALLTVAAGIVLAGLCWPLWRANRLEGLGGRDVWIDRWLGVRGVSLDGLRARLVAWIGLTKGLTWRGHGPGATAQALMGLHVRSGGIGIHGGHAHNEPLEYVYDYGGLGALAVGWACWRIAPGLRLGDPLSAAVVAGAVTLLGTAILRSPATGVPWWALAAWSAA